MYNAEIDLLNLAYDCDVAVARTRAKQKNFNARISGAFSLSEQQFIKSFRLSKERTQTLITELEPYMPPTLRSDGLNVETKVLVALAFYATGSYQTIVGESRNLCVSQASVSKAVQQVTSALNTKAILNKYVCFPFQSREREDLKREFYRQFKMPGLLGCIDGTHVAIVRPSDHEERFYNRKGYHSLNVMIICDANLNILCVDSSYPGATHDSVVWANHPLNSYLGRLHTISGEDVYLLGDSGYPLRSTLITPYPDPVPDTPEAHFQDLHLNTRSVVERCIGVLKARFRCLLVDRKLHYNPTTAAKIINACCVLHNIAHGANFLYTPLTSEEAAEERRQNNGTSRSLPQGRSRAVAQLPLELGRARRQALTNRLWTNRTVLI